MQLATTFATVCATALSILSSVIIVAVSPQYEHPGARIASTTGRVRSKPSNLRFLSDDRASCRIEPTRSSIRCCFNTSRRRCFFAACAAGLFAALAARASFRKMPGVAADLEEAGKAYEQANPEAQKPAGDVHA